MRLVTTCVMQRTKHIQVAFANVPVNGVTITVAFRMDISSLLSTLLQVLSSLLPTLHLPLSFDSLPFKL